MMIFWLLAVGLVALVAGAELLVRGASQIALRLGISSLLVGLTVVAFGTSAPELAVSVTSGINGQPDIALGNVVGSNILNVLLILGLSALLAPLVVHRGLVTAELPIMIVVSLLVIVMSADGLIGRLEGGLLSFGLLVFVGWQIVQARRQARTSEAERQLLPENDRDGKSPGFGTGRVRFLSVQIGLIAGGLVLMVLGAGWMVDGATRLTLALGVSELVISLTIVACGTSLPELATSATAALRGER
ncbi:MAG TPA: calcium/sodium antiporter, partial [Planctomycetaceae bacterium]|nr:calcium/sodium antiporter [Planctomycetaceae bacterium]